MKEILVATALILAVGYVDGDTLPTEEELEADPPRTLEQFEEVHGFQRFAVPNLINPDDPDPEDLPPAWHHSRHMARTY